MIILGGMESRLKKEEHWKREISLLRLVKEF